MNFPAFRAMCQRRWLPCVWFVLFGCFAAQILAAPAFARETRKKQIAEVKLGQLPPEARDTIVLIKKRGPYPFKRDGMVFGNLERRLPVKKSGYYHEFTVKTPGAKDRGARRIIGGMAGEYYYTDDHYQTFLRIIE
jgi:ribonuclease T1